MSESANNIQVQTINHLGIIAGIIDEIGLVEIINEQLGIQPQEKLNNGIIVKSIILNALGFVSRPLYLFTLLVRVPLRVDRARGWKGFQGYSSFTNLSSI